MKYLKVSVCVLRCPRSRYQLRHSQPPYAIAEASRWPPAERRFRLNLAHTQGRLTLTVDWEEWKIGVQFVLHGHTAYNILKSNCKL